MTTVASRVTRAERKDWARERFLGAECSLLPSFKPGTADLDEEGVRHDVRLGIRQGFYSMFCAGIGLKQEDRRRFVEIAVDEAGEQMLISTGAGARSSVAVASESLREAQSTGVSHVMFGLPSGPDARTEDEIYAFAREVIDSTDLGIVLYAQRGEQFRHIHPGNVPLGVYERLAELPNVVGVKITQVLDAVTTYELCDRVGEKLLLGPVNLEHLPFIASVCPVQCTMMWQVDACQAPEQPYVVDYLKLLAQGRIDEAVGVYRRMEPLVQLFWDEQAAVLREGGHPWAHLKYHTWCVGGNGGFLPEAAGGHDLPPLTGEDRQRIREAYARCGITPRGPEAEFDAGRVSFGRG